MNSFSAARSRNSSSARLVFLGIIIAFSFIIYLVHLFFMQVVDLSVYENRADMVSKRSKVIQAKRGEIFDRSYSVPLASNHDSFVLTLNPDEMDQKDIPATISRLSKLLSIPEIQLSKKIPKNTRLYQSIDLYTGLQYDQLILIAEKKADFPGITWQSKPVRNYPLGPYTAQILGYVGEITPEEIQILYNRGYSNKSIIGKNGIERNYDQFLRGKDGLRFRRVDAQGKGIQANNEIIVPPVLGRSLILTIDAKIQELAAKALGKRIGSVVVMKPSNGAILAMVSYPSYNPNQFYTEQSANVFSKLARDPSSPFINRAIQAAAPPASTFKVLMTAAVLEEQAFSPNKTVFCSGSIMIGNRKFSCHEKTGHGHVNLYQALAESCNVYYYTIGSDYLGAEKIIDYCDKFGLGIITGIDLPGEISGNVPTPSWKQQVYKTPWVGGDTVNLSIGQGFLTTTPLQLASMTSMIVNGGVSYQPHLLKEVRDSVTRELIESYTPKVLHTSSFSLETLNNLKLAMRGVVEFGTAKEVVTTNAVKIAAKTGTAQTGGGENDKHSWFISYAPYEYTNPEEAVVVVVWVDAVNAWEWWAPKAANIIMHGIFKNLSYEETIKDLQPLWYLNIPEEYKLQEEESL